MSREIAHKGGKVQKFFYSSFLALALLFHFAPVLNASEEPVAVELLAEDQTVSLEHPFWVAIHFDIAKDWHIYWKNPGDAGITPQISWQLPEGFEVINVDWPYPERFVENNLVTFGYVDSVTLLAQVKPSKQSAGIDTFPIIADVQWVSCSEDTCLPGESHMELSLKANASVITSTSSSFDTARTKLAHTPAHVEASRKNGKIELIVNQPGTTYDSSTEVYFFPENVDIIDHHEDAALIASLDDPAQYVISLKPADKDGKNEVLKGVLVVSGEALHIDTPIKEASASSTGQEAEESFFLMLVLAFAGGMILNLMPCVLPVVAFKVMGFVKMAGQSRAMTIKHGLVFALGVLVSFWVLTSALLLMQAYGHAVGWGFQLQEPLFVAVLAALMLIFGLSLFGVFEMGAAFASRAGQMQVDVAQGKGNELTSSFFSGILATAVATPCTGPFLGTAIGYAVTLSPIYCMVIFTFLGLGMACPYLLLVFFPSLLRWLPKPGPWMESFKQFMGFLMVATVLWLLWVFASETSEMALFILLISFFVLSIGCWIYGRWGSPVKKFSVRVVSYVLTASCLIAAGYAMKMSVSPVYENHLHDTVASAIAEDAWEPFSAVRMADLRKRGIPVFVDFTAKWCLICQTNHLVLTTYKVEEKMKSLGVVKMKADWTKKNPEITEELRKYGRNGVPLYLLYGKDMKPTILPQVLTPEAVVEQLEKM